jgi:Fic family protein
LRAALAYLGFTAIHAFNDGNRLIIRPVAEMVLSRSKRSTRYFFFMSVQIRESL